MACALALALLKAGNSMAARMAMMAITTSSSMRVKARDRVAKWLRFPTRQTNDGGFGEGTHIAWTCFGSIVLRPLSDARKECGLRPKKAEAVTDSSRRGRSDCFSNLPFTRCRRASAILLPSLEGSRVGWFMGSFDLRLWTRIGSLNLGAPASRRRVDVSSQERHASGTLALSGRENVCH